MSTCLLICCDARADSHVIRDQNLPLPSNAQTFTGDLTYYNPALGACGIESNDNSPIVAVSHVTFDAVQTGSDPNQNPLCGRKIRARRVREDGKEVTIDVTVVDRCESRIPTSQRGSDDRKLNEYVTNSTQALAANLQISMLVQLCSIKWLTRIWEESMWSGRGYSRYEQN